MREILGVLEVSLGIFEKTKEKKDRAGSQHKELAAVVSNAVEAGLCAGGSSATPFLGFFGAPTGREDLISDSFSGISTGVKKASPGKLRKKSEKGLPGLSAPWSTCPKKVENESKTSQKPEKLEKGHFRLFFEPFLTLGPRGPGTPFPTFFGVSQGEAF